MFSKNNRISKRQIFRLLTYDLLGIGTLLLPTELAKNAGKNSLLGIGLGILLGLIFVAFLGWTIDSMEPKESYFSYLKRSFGKLVGSFLAAAYGIYYLGVGGYCVFTFGKLMQTQLLKEQSFYWITAGTLLIAIYGIFRGIEGRARVYEILFWFLMAPLFIMLFFSGEGVDIPRLFPIYNVYDGKGFLEIIESAYRIFGIFSLTGFALFLVPFATDKKSIKRAARSAVVFSGVVFLVLYAILQGMFGVKAMAKMEYPAVVLMSMIQIPGGFLQRQDAIMVAIWFFTIFALLSSSMFYGAETVKQLIFKKRKGFAVFLTAALVYGIGIGCYRSEMFSAKVMEWFFWVATPLIIGIPILAKCSLKIKGKSVKAGTLLLAVSCVVLFSGCSTMELENRSFPLAMGIDSVENNCRISYKFENLASVSSQNASGGSKTDFYIEDKDFFTGISKYANETNKILDYNHMKVLILGKDFLEDEKSMNLFLEICQAKDLIARNTLVFLAEDAAKMLALDKNLDQSIGSYLQELIESREDYKLKDTVTLGDIYNDWENKEQLLLIPVLNDKGGLPVIDKYYAVSGGIPSGEISMNDAILSYLTQGKLKKLSFSMDDGTPVSIERISVNNSFSRGEGIAYHTEITLEVSIETMEQERIHGLAKKIEAQLYEANERLHGEQRIDITNSFYRLGMSKRDKYEKYLDKLEEYNTDVECSFDVKCIFVQ